MMENKLTRILGSFLKLGRQQRLTEEESRLVEAAAENNLPEVRHLLEIGVNPNAPPSGDGTALLYAADNGNDEMVKLLLSYGANVNHQDEVNGSALEAACVIGSKEIAELLINAGADVNARSYLGGTPLGYATYHNHPGETGGVSP